MHRCCVHVQHFGCNLSTYNNVNQLCIQYTLSAYHIHHASHTHHTYISHTYTHKSYKSSHTHHTNPCDQKKGSELNAPPQGVSEWNCSDCTLLNKPSVKACTLCGKTRAKPSQVSRLVVSNSTIAKWKCDACTLENESVQAKCTACATPRTGKSKSKMKPKSSQQWSCKACTFSNKPSASVCAVCSNPQSHLSHPKAKSDSDVVNTKGMFDALNVFEALNLGNLFSRIKIVRTTDKKTVAWEQRQKSPEKVLDYCNAGRLSKSLIIQHFKQYDPHVKVFYLQKPSGCGFITFKRY